MMTTYRNKIATLVARIKRRREALHMTQAQVAALAGIRQGNYSRMESGRQTPNLETLLAVMDVLNLDLQTVPIDETVYHVMYLDEPVTDVILSDQLSTEALVMTSGSSVGTQPKYYDKGYWYKSDRSGYESTAEYLMSVVLSCSNITDYVSYEKCTINGRPGCRCASFLKEHESFVSFQRLYDMYEGGNLSERILPMNSVDDRIRFVQEFIRDAAGVDVAAYLSAILSLDMLSLNTDRHFHNLGLILNRETNAARTAPIFDNADALLSNYNKFNPDLSMEELLSHVYAQPFSSNHELQAQTAGITLRIDYLKLLPALSAEPDSRALRVLKKQLDRYQPVLAI